MTLHLPGWRAVVYFTVRKLQMISIRICIEGAHFIKNFAHSKGFCPDFFTEVINCSAIVDDETVVAHLEFHFAADRRRQNQQPLFMTVNEGK